MEEDLEPEMEEWRDLIRDLGNTRGIMTLYKQALHVYWVLKHLLAKAVDQVAGEMAKLPQGMPSMKKEMKNLQIIMIMQDSNLKVIQQQLKKLTPVARDEATTPKKVEENKV